MKLLNASILYSNFCQFQYVLSLLLILYLYPVLKFLLQHLLVVFLKLFYILLFSIYARFHTKYLLHTKFVHQEQNLIFLYSISMLTFHHLIRYFQPIDSRMGSWKINTPFFFPPERLVRVQFLSSNLYSCHFLGHRLFLVWCLSFICLFLF